MRKESYKDQEVVERHDQPRPEGTQHIKHVELVILP